MKSTIFWDITPCSPLKVNRRFEGDKFLRNVCYLLHAGLLLGLFFDPEDGGYMFLRNVGCFNGLHGVISEKIVFFRARAVHARGWMGQN
jgi:hypothetical protein